MSLKKSATRRLSLLAGSSLIAASLSALTFTSATLAPSMAYAYDECTVSATATVPPTLSDGPGGASDPALNDPGLITRNADSYSCGLATYSTGIAYSSQGNLTVTKPSGSMTINSNGVDLTGNATDSVTFNFAGAAGGPAGGAGPVGPLIDVTSVSGAINISSTGVIGANRTGTTHGIRATSTGGGAITISSGAQSVNNNGVDGQAGIEAVTNGGDIIISGRTQGQRRGVVATTSGAGSVAITLANATASTVDGIVGIDATAGAGGISIATNGAVNGGAGGLAIRGVTAGSATLNHTQGVITGAVDLSGVAVATTFTLTGSSRWEASGVSVFGGGNDTLNMTNQQTNLLANGGSLGFGAGNDTFNLTANLDAGAAIIDFGVGADTLAVGGGANSGLTAAGTTINFGDGADTLNVTARLTLDGATANFGEGNDTLNLNGVLTTDGATLDFGAGVDTFNIASSLTVGVGVTFSNLEALNNSGVIYMGGQGGGTTNLAPGDVLALPGATFTGSGASRVVMDIDFAAGGQDDCSSPTAADCLDFTGGSTDGSTLITVRDAGGSPTAGSSSRTTIVVGATEAGNFTLDPNSSGYVLTDQGGALRRRLFDYYLLYDPDDLKYVFAGVPHVEAFQIATVAASAQDIWRTTTGSWFDRQADLRATPGGIEPSRGLWARAGVSVGDRDLELPYELLGTDFGQDVSYSQRTTHVTFGADVLGAATQNGAWVLGVNGGFVRSDLEYEAPSAELIYAGFSGGLYASLLAGPLFIDAAINTNLVRGESDAQSLGFEGDVKLTQTITSVGGQAQAGWRFAVGEAMFAEPLVSVSYVETELDEIEVPGDAGTLTYDEGAKSLRAGAGLRVGLDSELMGQAASFSLTGRYWNELEGENGTVLTGNAPTLLVDDYSGSFSEVTGSLNLYSSDGGVSGFVNLGGKFADGYQSIDGSVGVRMRW